MASAIHWFISDPLQEATERFALCSKLKFTKSENTPSSCSRPCHRRPHRGGTVVIRKRGPTSQVWETMARSTYPTKAQAAWVIQTHAWMLPRPAQAYLLLAAALAILHLKPLVALQSGWYQCVLLLSRHDSLQTSQGSRESDRNKKRGYHHPCQDGNAEMIIKV
jgi:hypothetical protein